MSGPQASSRRQWCYLCDLPKMPWAMLWDFSEAVCRGCVNYDGADRIELLIDTARQLRFTHGVLDARSQGKPAPAAPEPGRQQPEERADKRYEHRTWSRLPNGLHRPEEAALLEGSRHSPSPRRTAAPSLHGAISQALIGQGLLAAPSDMLAPLAVSRSLGAPAAVPAESGRRQAAAALAASTSAAEPALWRNGEVMLELNEAVCRRAQGWPNQPKAVQDVLAILSGCVPFGVRFRKEHALVGRVLAFDAAPELELKVFVEYPAASGLVFSSIPDLVRQMFRDLAKDAGKSVTSGLRYVEYEKQAGDWRPLSELLSEDVRVFREPPVPDVLPQPDAGGQTQAAKASVRRRKPSPGSSEGGESAGGAQHATREAWFRLEPLSGLGGPPEGPPPISVLMGVADAGSAGHMSTSTSYSSARQPMSSGLFNASAPPPASSSSTAEPPASAAQLCCTLCQEHLEDTHFVQCPSVPLHKFCFPCTRGFIRGQDPGGEVYCPSGERCPLSGSNVPWAFMQGEISTILAGEGVSVKKESES